MTRHGERGSDGRFVSTQNTPEADEHSVKGIESSTELSLDNVSADARGPLDDPRYAPSGDEIDGGTAHRRAILVDAQTGGKLGEIGLADLHSVLDRASQKRLIHRHAVGGDDHLDYLVSGE
ncbi:MAG TPA: hypothetical protein VMU95_00060 [Trebonia sp.]|nr:hypothetical protein [Trebonia sp.]